MPAATFVLPGPIARTGGYIYDLRMIDGLRALGWDIDIVVIDGIERRFAGMVADGRVAVVDGLALGAMPDDVEAIAARGPVVGVIHLPLTADVTRTREEIRQLEPLERRALGACSRVVVTSGATLPMLARYALPNDRVVVVEPGTDRVARARPSRRSAAGEGEVHLLCVATVNAGKGHELLLRALARVAHREWRLTCAGSLTRDAGTVERVRATITELGLGERVTLAGELDEAALDESYATADVFVLATRQETYGMAAAEAIAHGLPVISTSTGAIPAIVGDGGVIVAPDDLDALARALDAVLGDAALRARLAAAARRQRDLLPTWDDAARAMSDVLMRLGAG
jgi:glycosyltransferase involved in cell wall biosynthesis